ncbi:MAG: hypothetical protein JNM17_21740, partial [Archangium sp.]|nr:hypothetical protein [Archangium sp.]
MRRVFAVASVLMSACSDPSAIEAPRADVECPTAHAEEYADTSEPDECMAIAFVAAVDATLQRTIQPAGDIDWTRFTVTPGHVYNVRVSGLRPVELQVFDHLGTLLTGADGQVVVFAATDSLYAS